ncbi:MAG: hypothetical protein RLZZ15_1451, partial [Verrucomicrobiota bacterium]
VTFNQPVTVATGWFTLASTKNGALAATVTGGPTTYTITPPVKFTDNDTVTVNFIAAQITESATGTLHPAANTTISFTTAVPVAPSITTPPVAATVNAGATATFTVVAGGTAPFSYQWRKGGVNITGNPSANTATLSLANVQSGDAANYDVVVGNGVGTDATSTAVALTVTPVAPTIVTPPAAATLLYGSNATFTVVASGTTPFTYQWRKGGVNLANGAVTNAATVSGATTITLTLTSITSLDAGNYDVVVTNSVNSTTSAAAALTVTLPPPGPQTNYAGGAYAQNFDTLPTTGTTTFTGAAPFDLSAAPANATGLAGWSLVGISGTPTLIAGTGTATNGAAYSYASAAATTDRALGSQGSGSVVARFGVSFVNTTGATLNTFTLGYTGEQWRNGGSTNVNKLTFAYGLGATNLSVGAFTNVDALSLSSVVSSATAGALDGNAAANRIVLAPVTITGLAWAPGQTLVLRWSDADDTGADDGLAIDDLTFTATPVITTAPVAQTVNALTNVSFTVATSATPVTYQWRRNAVAITGNTSATTATLTLTAVNAASAGAYDCVVTNSAGSTASPAAALVVNKLPATVALSNLSQNYDGTAKAPTAVTTPAGLAVDFTYNGAATAINAGTYTVAATINDLAYAGTTGGTFLVNKAVANITLASLNTTYDGTAKSVLASTTPAGLKFTLTYAGDAAAPTDAGTYIVAAVLTEANYTGSSSAVLTIARATQTVAFAPITGVVTVGVPFTLGASASSGLPVTFSVVSGNATLAGASATFTDAAPVTLRATQTGTANLAAASAELTLTAGKQNQSIAFAALADVTAGPAPLALNATATSGLAVTFTVVSGPATISGSALTLTGASGTVVVRAAQAGNTVFNAAPSVDRSFVVTAAPRNTAPVITSQPTAQVAQLGAAASFTVVATGTPAPTYLWRKNGNEISGATSATLAFTSVVAGDAAGYDVVVTNSVSSTTSSLARLTVATVAVAPVITRQPGNVTVVAGRSATFTVVATGAPAPTYQWFRSVAQSGAGAPAAPIPGATSATLTLANVTTADAGNYSVVVTNSAGAVTSAPATLTVLRRSYAGSYFGTLGTGGTFALLIGDDNMGVFLGFAPGSSTAYVSRAVTVDDTGAFRFTTTTSGTPAAAAAPLPGAAFLVVAAAVNDLAFTGTISDTGALTGAATGGAGISLAGAKTADTGAASAVAGFYQATAAGSSAQTLTIVSATGQAFVLAQTGATADAGTGTVDATGKLTVTTAARGTISATVTADTAALTATVTTAAGVSTTFTGFADNSAALAQQRIVNISTRTTAGIGDQVAIVGFVITGLESKPVLIRAVGPALRALGVTTALAAPRLDLRNATSLLLANTGWGTAGNAAEIANAAARS